MKSQETKTEVIPLTWMGLSVVLKWHVSVDNTLFSSAKIPKPWDRLFYNFTWISAKSDFLRTTSKCPCNSRDSLIIFFMLLPVLTMVSGSVGGSGFSMKPLKITFSGGGPSVPLSVSGLHSVPFSCYCYTPGWV